jgi:hypothetical protein
MISYGKFVAMSKELAAGGGWVLSERASPFGGATVYLKSTVEMPVHGSLPQSSSTAAPISWDDDDEDVVTSPEPSVGVAEVTFYLCYSEAYQVPQLYFTGFVRREGDPPVRSYLSSSDDWNALVFGSLCETELVVPATRPIIGTSYCEELGLAAMSLHQCDTSDMIQQCEANNVQDTNALRSWLRLLASSLRLPSSLLN